MAAAALCCQRGKVAAGLGASNRPIKTDSRNHLPHSLARMTAHVSAHIGTQRFHCEALGPRVCECSTDQLRGDAAALQCGRHLSVQKADRAVVQRIVDTAQPAVEKGLEPMCLRVVYDFDGGSLHRSSVSEATARPAKIAAPAACQNPIAKIV